MDDPQYLLLGHCPQGVAHAAQTYWSSAVCSAPLVRVDDHHRLKAGQLLQRLTCWSCVDLIDGSDREGSHQHAG